MDVRKLQKIAVAALEDIKAKDIEVINTRKLTSLFDRIVIASADSTRQVKALARHVEEKVREAGGQVLGVEGEETGEWVLVDLGDVVVHVMQPAIRDYYRLEEIWGDKPVKMKLDGESRPAVVPLPMKKAVAPKKATASKTARKAGAVKAKSAPSKQARKSTAHSS